MKHICRVLPCVLNGCVLALLRQTVGIVTAIAHSLTQNCKVIPIFNWKKCSMVAALSALGTIAPCIQIIDLVSNIFAEIALHLVRLFEKHMHCCYLCPQ